MKRLFGAFLACALSGATPAQAESTYGPYPAGLASVSASVESTGRLITQEGMAVNNAGNGGGGDSRDSPLRGIRPPGGPAVILSPLVARGIVGRQFTYQFEEIGGTYGVEVTNLPPGLIFDANLMAITGTPTAMGTFGVGLRAWNPFSEARAVLALTVQPYLASGPTIISSTSATGQVMQPFTFQVITAGSSPAARLRASGLPQGLNFDPVSGLISGTPTSFSYSAVTLEVTDGALMVTGVLELTFPYNYSIRPIIVSSSSASLTPGQPFSYSIVAPSETSFTLIGQLPAGLRFDANTGTISGVWERPDDVPGRVIANVQLFACNSGGCGTAPLNFFRAPTGTVNTSTRLAVGTGESALIAGFIVIGNAPKKVLVRAIGPELTGRGVPDALQDPTLELHASDGSLLASNDNWRDSQENEIAATGLAPTDNRESAILAALSSATQGMGYTAIVRGTNGTAGVGLVEAYDFGTVGLDTSSSSKLANISARGFAQTGDNVMIGGFIISGAATRVIVRAIGPELTGRGVPGALQDTTLELRDGSGSLVASNDDWRSTQAQQIIDSGLAPTDDRESAIIATLTPGGYTGIARGKNDTSGVALVEVFGLP